VDTFGRSETTTGDYNKNMSTKSFIWLGIIVGSVIGSWIGGLLGDGLFSWQSILGNTVGALIGIYAGYKISQNL